MTLGVGEAATLEEVVDVHTAYLSATFQPASLTAEVTACHCRASPDVKLLSAIDG